MFTVLAMITLVFAGGHPRSELQKTHIPVLVPSVFRSEDSGKAYAEIADVTPEAYTVRFSNAFPCGAMACSIGSIEGGVTDAVTGDKNLRLKNGIVAKYTPFTCGADCSDAILMFRYRGVTYSLALHAGSPAEMLASANSLFPAKFTPAPNPTATPPSQNEPVGTVSAGHTVGASAVVRQLYAWIVSNPSRDSWQAEGYAPVRGLFDDRFYWLLNQEGADHPGSKPRYGMECEPDASPFIQVQKDSRIWSFMVGAPIAQGNAVVVPVTLFWGHGSGEAFKITAIVEEEAGAYKIYDIKRGGSDRQALERQAHDPNCAWPNE